MDKEPQTPRGAVNHNTILLPATAGVPWALLVAVHFCGRTLRKMLPETYETVPPVLDTL